ncbi:MAG: hypothetical protein ACREQ2_28360, partial [Candidatus Binatia bacterium]
SCTIQPDRLALMNSGLGLPEEILTTETQSGRAATKREKRRILPQRTQRTQKQKRREFNHKGHKDHKG